jgi:hypothetical protein
MVRTRSPNLEGNEPVAGLGGALKGESEVEVRREYEGIDGDPFLS